MLQNEPHYWRAAIRTVLSGIIVAGHVNHSSSPPTGRSPTTSKQAELSATWCTGCM